MSIDSPFLFISVFKDMSGYASSARNYARALSKITDKMVLRSIRYDSGSQTALLPELKIAHKRDTSNINTVVQMLTPNEMRPIPGKRNIAIFCWETDKIPQYWADKLNQFDKVVVPCDANIAALELSGVKRDKLVKIPFCFFQEDYDVVGKYQIPGTDDDTVIFGNISQWSPKKGIDSIIQSYYLAFQNNENVLLVLKGYMGMQNQQGDAQKLIEQIKKIRDAMRLPIYPRIYVTDIVGDNDSVLKLHNTLNVYVNLAHGEGWSIPTFESLLMNKELISVVHTGMQEYLDGQIDKFYPVGSRLEPVIGMSHPDPLLYTSLENWYTPDVLEAVHAFRSSFNTLEKRNKDKTVWLEKTDPSIIGQKLLEVING